MLYLYRMFHGYPVQCMPLMFFVECGLIVVGKMGTRIVCTMVSCQGIENVN